MSRTLHVFRIEDGEQHWYVATSARAALAAFVKDSYHPMTVREFRKEYPETTVTQCPDGGRMAIGMENERADFDRVTHTYATWAKLTPPGFLATTLI